MVSLYPHQQAAVEKLGNGKILWGGVGTGKSRTALAYYLAEHSSKDVIVITTAKKRDSFDWVGDAAAFGIGTSADATVAGVLTVDSWNNIEKYTEVKNAFFIFDEQRLVGSGSWTKAFIKIAKQNAWILLTATPGDTWLDYIPVFIANGFYKNRTEFLQEHVVFNRFSKFPKVDRFIQVGRLVRYRNLLLVEMPFERHTTRKVSRVEVAYDESLFKKVLVDRWNVYENRPLKNVAELFLVMRRVVNSNTSRTRKVKELLEKHPKLIVFYNFNFELEQLRSLSGTKEGESESWRLSSPEQISNESSDTGSPTGNGDGSKMKENPSNSRVELNPKLVSTTLSMQETPGLIPSSRPAPAVKPQPLAINPSPNGCSESSGIGIPPTTAGFETEKEKAESWKTQSSGTSTPTSPSTQEICSEAVSSSDTERLTDTSTLRPTLRSSATVEESLSNSSSHLDPWTQCEESLSSPVSKNSEKIAEGSSKDTSITEASQESTLPTKSFAIAEWNGHKHQPIPETDSWIYLVQYAAGSEGWNCIETNAMVFYSLTYSYKNWHQAFGRIDRLNTPFTKLHYYVLMSTSLIDKAIWSSLMGKKNFNENRFLSKFIDTRSQEQHDLS